MTLALNKVIYGGRVLVDLTDSTMDSSSGDQILDGQTAYGRDGEKITGSCTFDSDTKDATATAGDILAQKTAYVNGNKITGTIPERGAGSKDLTFKNELYTILQGYYDGTGSVKIAQSEQDKIIPGNIKLGVDILGVIGTYDGDIEAQAKTVDPYTTQQTILPDAGYDYLSRVTINAIHVERTPNTWGTTIQIGKVKP